MARQTHFEVHVQQHGRWTIHARYPLYKKDSALEDAKQIDSQQVGQVKVIREVFDDESGHHEEYTIYKTPVAGQASAMEEAMGQISHTPSGGGGGGKKYISRNYVEPEWKDFNPSRKSKGKQGTSVSILLVKILVMILISTMISVIATMSASVWIEGVSLFGTVLVGSAKSNALSAIFFVSFAVGAVSLSAMLFRHDALASRKGKRGGKRGKSGAEKAADGEQGGAKKKEQTKADGVSIKAAVEELRRSFDDETLQAANEDTPETLKTEKEAGPEETLSPAGEKQKQLMVGFMQKSLGAVGDIQKMDNFNKFGVNLYMAGACEALARKHGLNDNEHTLILSGAVRAAGFKKNRAAAFARRYEEYLGQDPRYSQVFQAGQNAMGKYFENPSQAPHDMKAALEEWAKPKSSASSPSSPSPEAPEDTTSGELAVLFTDIAGSTALTQKLGDVGAQQVVRAHNKVVREALNAHGGLEAAADMQKGAMAVRNALKLPLHLKIGLHAGDVIQEDNDLFGATVQMAARIVDVAGADEIFISGGVHADVKDTGRQFINRGAHAAKGFEEDPVLWEVKWWDGAQSPKLKTAKNMAPPKKPAAVQAGPQAVQPQAAAAGGGAPARRGVRLVQKPPAQ
ncbi:MAG: adenylate/guanylate cyclase domain-containing protein [Rhodospirillales bacterium]